MLGMVPRISGLEANVCFCLCVIDSSLNARNRETYIQGVTPHLLFSETQGEQDYYVVIRCPLY